MRIRFTVGVDVDHIQGKFVAKEEIADQIFDALEDADPGAIDVGESEYEVATWDVDEVDV